MMAVLLCAGFGTRLYPITRDFPKPLLEVRGRPLVEDLVEQLLATGRVAPLVVVSNARFAERFRTWRDALAARHPGVEIEVIDDGAPDDAQRLGAVRDLALALEGRQLSEAVIVAAGDNLFRFPVGEFLDDHAARPRNLILVHRETDLERLRRTGVSELGVDGRVLRFVEKPDRDNAQAYVASGRHFWNAGIFVWDSQTFRRALQRYLPEVAKAISGAIAAFGSSDFPDALINAYSRCPAVSLDYGVMERLPAFSVVKAAFRWSDIGSWDEWGSLAGQLEGGNRGTTRLCPLDSRGNVIYAPRKTVALVGVDDLIIVDTDDALLVCRADAAQRIRDVTEQLRGLDLQDLL